MHQPRAAALGALDAFRWILPVTATLAVAIALLLGSILIRRSHAPLRLLTQAARRIARRDFSQPVACESRDEYGRLIRTFNRMADNLQSQFTLQSSFSRIDEIILSHAGAAQAIDSVLPHLPGMLGCNVAGVLLMTPRGHAHVRMTADGTEPQDDLPLPLPRELLTRQGVLHVAQAEFPALFARAGVTTDELILCAITVAGTVRGHVIASDERPGRSALRTLQGIAQRIAVAIGNDDYEQALWRKAHLDPLTGLANRQLLQQRIRQAIDTGARGAVLFLDLDRFKSVNDSMGHSIGDVLLQQIAQRLAAVAPAGATVARFGGDEFVILMPHANAQNAQEYARHVLESLADPCTLRELLYVTHASAGIAIFPDHGTDSDVLLKHADIAMYRAKATGRGTLCLFDASMSADIAQRLRMEQRLREALAEDAIRACFQPKVDASGAIVAVEALARWRDADGFVAPALFIPVAEETGLIVALGATMLIQSCRQLRQWRDLGLSLQHVAVNISLLQLRDPAFPAFVERCLAESGLSGNSLELEVTESLFAEDGHAVAEQLHRLTRLGVRIAIDDFGTGFSSMSRLRDFPITTLKIDRSFVSNCSRSLEARLLLKALIDVGRALHLEVVAEGVETTDERDVLRELACEFMQGFLFAQALPADDMTRLLSMAKGRPRPLSRVG
jgi:diguanylate cyclase (GGDEF)-like protein